MTIQQKKEPVSDADSFIQDSDISAYIFMPDLLFPSELASDKTLLSEGKALSCMTELVSRPALSGRCLVAVYQHVSAFRNCRISGFRSLVSAGYHVGLRFDSLLHSLNNAGNPSAVVRNFLKKLHRRGTAAGNRV